MNAALLQLRWLSLRGRVIRSARLLREPKYLLGGVVGAGWILYWTLGTLWRSDVQLRFGDYAGFGAHDEILTALRLVAPLVLAVVFSVTWLIPRGRLGIPFREAELHVLLPAPVTRRQLIQYGLMKPQIGIFFTAFFLTLFAGFGDAPVRLRTFFALWVAFTIWDLNDKLRAMFLLRQREISVSAARLRAGAVVGAIAAFWLVVGPRTYRLAIEIVDARERGLDAMLARVGDASWTSLQALLLPTAIVTQPVFADGWRAFLIAFPAAVAVLIVHYELVVRSPARFEDQALEHARKLSTKDSPAKTLQKMSAGRRRRRPFHLRPTGRAETAVLWKNLMKPWRHSLAGTALAATAALTVAAATPIVFGWHAATYLAMMLVGAVLATVFTLTGGMNWGNDLRSEMRHIEYARTWPVRPHRLVLAEVASSGLLSFLLALFGVGLSFAGFAGARVQEWLRPSAEASLLPNPGTEWLGVPYELAGLLLVCGVVPLFASGCFVSSSLQNLAVLWLPAWVPSSEGKQKGIAALGQRLVFASGLALVMLFVAIPSAVLVGIALLIQQLAGLPWSAWAFPIWGGLAATPAFATAFLMVRAGGRMWQALDASSEILDS